MTEGPVGEAKRATSASGGTAIAAGMAIMNVASYGFTIVAARSLGPQRYGAVAGLMAVLLVVAVAQFGLQATAARRIAADPLHVAQIERVVLGVTYRAAVALGLVMLVLSPAVYFLLKLESYWPALLVAVAAVPLTVMGGLAGTLQGERRWHALAVLYMAAGVPRLVVGALLLWMKPTETTAVASVLIASLAPVAVGWWALRRPREAGHDSDTHAFRPVAWEAAHASLALLAFFALSNADVVIARNVLDAHDAGLYAGGLILCKAVLFLPQFVVVAAFPAMSEEGSRRLALLRALGVTAALGGCAVLGVLALPDLAMMFVGGEQYAEVESRLWLFAVLGTVLAMLQLVVYSVLARQGRRSTYLVWAAVAVLVVVGLACDSVDSLLVAVVVVDGVLLIGLLVLNLWQLDRLAAVTPEAVPTTAPTSAPTTAP